MFSTSRTHRRVYTTKTFALLIQAHQSRTNTDKHTHTHKCTCEDGSKNQARRIQCATERMNSYRHRSCRWDTNTIIIIIIYSYIVVHPAPPHFADNEHFSFWSFHLLWTNFPCVGQCSMVRWLYRPHSTFIIWSIALTSPVPVCVAMYMWLCVYLFIFRCIRLLVVDFFRCLSPFHHFLCLWICYFNSSFTQREQLCVCVWVSAIEWMCACDCVCACVWFLCQFSPMPWKIDNPNMFARLRWIGIVGKSEWDDYMVTFNQSNLFFPLSKCRIFFRLAQSASTNCFFSCVHFAWATRTYSTTRRPANRKIP